MTRIIGTTEAFRRCWRKVQFAHKRDADNDAQTLRRRYRNPYIEAYDCGFCGKWHVGKNFRKRV